jgi:hypothetical protein
VAKALASLMFMTRSKPLSNAPGYLISDVSAEESTKLLQGVIPRRRGPTQSVPGVTITEGCIMGDEMFKSWGRTEYLNMITAEMKFRPIPHVFEETETKPLTDLFMSWYPDILAWLIPQMRVPTQTYNKVSKVGWPGFFIPENKLNYVLNFVPEIMAGDLSRFEEAFISMNVRLQVDPFSKERDFLFMDGDQVVAKTITAADREVRTPIGRRIGSRTRLVFNLPVYNLVKQIWDSSVHDALIKWPAFGHNMFGGQLTPVRGHHVCMDVKHFERHTSACNRARAAAFGGVYAQCAEVTARIPFCVPTMDWKAAKMIHVDRAGGYSDQYGSGDSAVAPSQKEIMLALYAEFFHKELGYSRSDAVLQVASAGEERLTIRNYGDDNSVDGDKGVIEAFIAFCQQYLHVEEEKPPKFLGFVWYAQRGQWLLPPDSYLQKTYLNERAPLTNFRKYPFLGWVERRNIYKKLGHPDVPAKLFPQEDELLARVGLPWYKVCEYADRERRDAFAAREVEASHPLLLQNKEYLMTPQQQIAAGTHTSMSPSDTRKIFLGLVSKEITAKLNP